MDHFVVRSGGSPPFLRMSYDRPTAVGASSLTSLGDNVWLHPPNQPRAATQWATNSGAILPGPSKLLSASGGSRPRTGTNGTVRSKCSWHWKQGRDIPPVISLHSCSGGPEPAAETYRWPRGVGYAWLFDLPGLRASPPGDRGRRPRPYTICGNTRASGSLRRG